MHCHLNFNRIVLNPQLQSVSYCCCVVCVFVLQDVGLIFLSAMATGIAEIGMAKGMEDAEIVGTAMLTLTVATTLVGILTWLVGECEPHTV